MFNLPFNEGVTLYNKAFEKTEENKAWQLYCSVYPNFNKNNFKPFSEFYKAQVKPITNKPSDDILKEIEEIRNKFKNSHNSPSL